MDPRTKQDVKYKTSSLVDALSDKMSISTTKLKGEDTAGLDVAVVKATNTDEVVPKEKHVVTLRSACGPGSGMRTQHVIGSLLQRLESHKGKWLVTLKTLLTFHRLLREADPGFAGELLTYADRNGPRRMLRLDTFADHTTKAGTCQSQVQRSCGHAGHGKQRCERWWLQQGNSLRQKPSCARANSWVTAPGCRL